MNESQTFFFSRRDNSVMSDIWGGHSERDSRHVYIVILHDQYKENNQTIALSVIDCLIIHIT